MQPALYVKAVVGRTHADPATASAGITDRMYSLLSDYRISPGNWEYGTPYRDGYQDRGTYWDGLAATQDGRRGRVSVLDDAPADRDAAHTRVAHGSVGAHAGDLGELPDLAGAPVLAGARLARPGAHLGLGRARSGVQPQVRRRRRHARPTRQECPYLTTGAPERVIPARRVTIPWGKGTRTYTVRAHGTDNEFLWDGQGCDDVNIWAVLSRRFYGSFATPVEQKGHIDTQHELVGAIRTARARGAAIWSFTYTPLGHDLGSPGYAATEPVTDARVFGLWNALEGTDGTLYADGMTSYADGIDPYRSLALHGQHVLVYPALRSTESRSPRCASRASATASRMPTSRAW